MEENVSNLEHDLKTLEQYFSQNIMTINTTKTTFMIFHSPQRRLEFEPTFKLFGQPIRRVNEQKFLGIYLDQNLNWKAHISKLKKELSTIIGFLYHMRDLLDNKTKMMLYNALFHTKLTYAIETWGSSSKTQLKQLQSTQNRALKIVYKKPTRFPTTDLYQNVATSVLPVQAHHNYAVAVMTYKIKNEITNSNLAFTKVDHRYALRRRSNINVPSHNNLYGLRRFQLKSAKIWNELLNYGVSRENLNRFKSSTKEYYRSTLNIYL